jgi:hypothetical protein
VLSDLASWKAGDLAGCYVRLFTNPAIYNHANTPASYVEAAFAGYAPVVGPAWGVPFLNASSQGEIDSPVLTWTYTAGSGTQIVHGIFVTDPTNTKLFLAVHFLSPVTLSPAQPNLSRTLQITAIDQLGLT